MTLRVIPTRRSFALSATGETAKTHVPFIVANSIRQHMIQTGLLPGFTPGENGGSMVNDVSAHMAGHTVGMFFGIVVDRIAFPIVERETLFARKKQLARGLMGLGVLTMFCNPYSPSSGLFILGFGSGLAIENNLITRQLEEV